ncbi:heme biosynthesis HemY N-terminal domain-containing protein [Gammaproteobacteria bacterium AB-CW1]|uniref:Heme biosynthesis HemY N-terminal domain-containing protein n=1 Tax=Natronospira elongata TaxID=3110268 RepID=A0AAP6MM93_9GAMM|nr:heme biosynthesis HemY N-terminal domain-containing protein [Gammaproteobacteria bacterium AB-CW1]
MRRLLWFLLILLLAIGIGLLLRQDTGYALMSWAGWSVEMSLAMLAVFLLLGLTVLYYLLRLLRGLFRMPRRLRAGLRSWRRRRARRALTRGLIDLAEGRWQTAEKTLGRTAEDSETPLINYLVAARAAQLQGAHQRRDVYLKNAYEQTPSATVAVLLTQAELQLAHGQHEHALATLRRLQELSPGHRFGLRLLARAYQAVEDWASLHQILPQLRRQDVFRREEMETIERDCFRRLLQQRGSEGRHDVVAELWQKVPRRLRREQGLYRDYIRALLATDAQQTAERAIEDYLKAEWDIELVLLYGALEGGDPARRLKRAEDWLRYHPQDPSLLLSLARLCVRNELWGKARQYLDQSLTLEPSPDGFEELGRLLEHLGEQDRAATAYRQGLELAVRRQVGEPGTQAPIVPSPR